MPFPVAPAVMVPRRALLEQLDQSDATAVVVAAPGGFGKSTLLAQWLKESPKRVHWLQVPSGSHSSGVAERIALELAPPSSPLMSVLPMAHDESLWFSVVLPALQDIVSSRAEPFVLVLDDAMNIVDSRFDSLIDAVAASLPARSQLVVGTRGAPPHALRRLRATGRLLELRAEDLALDDDEAKLLLEELTVHLPEDQLARVVDRTEGWPVGIYLLGRAILKDPELLVADEVPGLGTEWITDFIRDELFDALDPESQSVLLRVSVLDELSAGACDATSGVSESLPLLRRLAAENQLITRVPGDGETYRLHPLFADFLSVELQGRSPSEFEGCHRRAAEWYASQGDDDRTVAHLRESGNDAALGDFVWSRAWRLLAKGQSPTLSRWLEGLAESRVLAHPGLCLTSAWVRTQEGDMAQVVHFATQARALVRQDEFFQPYASHVDVADAVIGREGTASIIDLCNSALESADSSDPWRSLAYFMRGVAHLHFGTVDEGMADLAAGCQIAKELDISHVRAQCLAAQATVRLSLGQAGVAGELAVAARAVVFDNKLEHLPTSAPIFTASALVLLATGQRREAVDDASRALRLTALMEPIAPWHAVEGRLRLGQTYWQLGDRERARVLTEEAREHYVPAARSPLLDQMLKDAESQVAAVEETPGPSLLTTAELRVLQYLPSHLSFPEIGQRLYLSRHTVKSQALSAYRKLGVASRSGAVTTARELGLLPPG